MGAGSLPAWFPWEPPRRKTCPGIIRRNENGRQEATGKAEAVKATHGILAGKDIPADNHANFTFTNGVDEMKISMVATVEQRLLAIAHLLTTIHEASDKLGYRPKGLSKATEGICEMMEERNENARQVQ